MTDLTNLSADILSKAIEIAKDKGVTIEQGYQEVIAHSATYMVDYLTTCDVLHVPHLPETRH